MRAPSQHGPASSGASLDPAAGSVAHGLRLRLSRARGDAHRADEGLGHRGQPLGASRRHQTASLCASPGWWSNPATGCSAARWIPSCAAYALQWKLDGVNAFHQTLFRPDPLAALFETWALAVQVDDWVNTERIRKLLGPLQPVVADAALEIRQEVQAAAGRAAKKSDGAKRMQEMVESWAHDHPIDGTFATRPTAELLLAKMASQEDTGLVEAFGKATSTLDDLSIKLDLYSASLPKTATWQVELAMIDGMETDNGKLIIASLQSLGGVFSKVDAMLAGAGGTGGRDIPDALKNERVAVMSDIDRQRVDVLDRLTEERVAVLQAIDGQRVATLGDLDRKIDRSLQGADGLRHRAMADSEPMITRVGLRTGALVGTLMCLGTLLFWLLLRSKAVERLLERRDRST